MDRVGSGKDRLWTGSEPERIGYGPARSRKGCLFGRDGFCTGPISMPKLLLVAPFGSVAVFAPPLGLSFPADIGRGGFCTGPISIPNLLLFSPFGSVAAFAPPLGLSLPVDIGRDGFCTGPISTPKLLVV
jgi:hypothetical protein